MKSFLVRIRHLKLNKEKIKEYLNTNHDLVKQVKDILFIVHELRT